MKRTAIPSTPIFSVATALSLGVSPNRLRGADLDRSVWGVRRSVLHDADVISRCVMFASRLREGCVYSHVTAALLWGAPLPWALETREELDIAVTAGNAAPHARGIRGHHMALDRTDVSRAHDLLVTSPARTWCDLASQLSLGDLVAVGDYLLHWRRPLTTREQLDAALRRMSGRRGVVLAREAIDLLSDRAESRPESKLRVIIIRAGLPMPEVNHSEVMTESGRSRRFDLVFRRWRLVLEYQGDYHRSKEQWRKDMTRRSELEADGWYVMEINADDLRDPAALVARIRAVLARRR